MIGVHTPMKEVRSEMTFYHHLCRPEPGLGCWPPMRQYCYKKRKFGDNNKDLHWG